MASDGIKSVMSILEVSEEKATALIEKHGSAEAAIKAGDADSDDEAPELADAGADATAAAAAAAAVSSAERKARKAFEGLDLKEQPGFKRVIINYGRQAAIQIDRPSVHRMVGTDYWVIFGTALPVDMSRSADAAKHFSLAGANPGAAAGAAAMAPEAIEAQIAAAAAAAGAAAPADAAAADASAEEVDLSGLPDGIVAKDVDFVASHAGVSRAEAVEALKVHKSVVPAAMSFSQ